MSSKSPILAAIIATGLASLGAAPASAQADTIEAVPSTPPVSPAQTQAIARFIKVWGFVKYHHNDAREGRLAMDVEFERLYLIMRNVDTLDTADRILSGWLAKMGSGAPCDPCAEDRTDLDIALETDTLRWLESLPAPLASSLKKIYLNRSAANANFYIKPKRGTRQPVFTNEADYSRTPRLGEESIRMLTLARQWNTLRYWFPYRDVMDETHDAVLPGAIAEFLAATTPKARHQAMARLSVAGNDGHIGLSAITGSFTPQGPCKMPYSWRFVEDRLVIDGRIMPAEKALKRGDVLTAIDGVSVKDMEAEFGPFIATSNPSWFQRRLAMILINGECDARQMQVERAGKRQTVAIDWRPAKEPGFSGYEGNGRAGDVIESLEDGVTYVRMQDLTNEQLPQLLETANAGKGLVLDLRGYPRGFFVFNLGAMMVDEPTEFAVFRLPDYATPGRFTWSSKMTIQPDKEGRRITVPIVALVDEATISKPEYHSMAFRAAGATIIGSQTAGADGDVSQMPLPNGARMRFSGLGVFYPDGKPTQRIGIVPDIEVKPTLAGIAAGRDEVLEEAARFLTAEAPEDG